MRPHTTTRRLFSIHLISLIALAACLVACGADKPQQQADKVHALLLKLDTYREQHFRPANYAAYARAFPPDSWKIPKSVAADTSAAFDATVAHGPIF